jgi:mediator of RNA polymerase II transcription subunit 17, fungi type
LDQLLEFFNKPFESIATISLPSISSSRSDPTPNPDPNPNPNPSTNLIKIEACTSLAPPLPGTVYKITLPPSLSALLHLHPAQNQKPLEFRNQQEVREYIDWLLTMDIAHGLLGREFAKRGVVRGEDGAFSVKVMEKGKVIGRSDVDVVVDVGEVKVAVAKWKGGERDERVWVWRSDGEGEGIELLEKVREFLG